MKPHKHPLLFSALALVFSLILLLQPVIALEWWQELALAEGLTTAEGYLVGTPIGWPLFIGNLIYVHNLNKFVESKSAVEAIESYAQGLFDKDKNFLEIYRDSFNLLAYSGKLWELYFVRRAEYNSLNYLGNETFPEEVMTPVVQDMRRLIVRIKDQLNYFFDELWIDQEQRFPEGYHYVVSEQYPPSTSAEVSDPYEGKDDIMFAYVLDSASTNETIIWDLESLKPVTIEGETVFDATKYLVIAPGHFEFRYYEENVFTPYWNELRYIILYDPNNQIVDHIDLNGLMQHLTDIYNTLREHYTTAKSYAMTYWSWLRSLGFTSRSQVPDEYTCPPPSALFRDLSNVEKITPFSIARGMLGWLESLSLLERLKAA